MTASRKQIANCNNARASTGPKTVTGKARVRRNARRHGLAARNRFVGTLANEANALAHCLVGSNVSPAVLTAALRIAEAQIDLVQVRAVRHRLIAPGLSDEGYGSQTYTAMPTRKMLQVTQGPATSEKFMFVLSDAAKQLRALDRYEARALARRKRASEDLDTIRILEAVDDNNRHEPSLPDPIGASQP
jgi:hypothetical protein